MLLGNWQISAINTATSGQPVNLTYSEPAAFDVSDLLAYRPNVSGNPVTPSGQRIKTSTAISNFLNSSTVSLPTDQATPTEARGAILCATIRSMSSTLACTRVFRLWSESSLLDIRGEAFNLLNHVNYGAPNSNRTDGSFGSITSFFPPRQLQVAAKLIF